MPQQLSIQFEKAVQLLVEHLPPSDENSRKPILFHDLRVGVYLYENGYSSDIILAGLLHDIVEWSNVDQQILQDEFGENVLKLILACTKDDKIKDKLGKTNELIERCMQNGLDALIVKSADIIDSFKWYSSQNNKDQLRYCLRTANAIFQFKPADFQDKIFHELKSWQEKYSHLSK